MSVSGTAPATRFAWRLLRRLGRPASGSAVAWVPLAAVVCGPFTGALVSRAAWETSRPQPDRAEAAAILTEGAHPRRRPGWRVGLLGRSEPGRPGGAHHGAESDLGPLPSRHAAGGMTVSLKIRATTATCRYRRRGGSTPRELPRS